MTDAVEFVNEESLTELFASVVWDTIPRKSGGKYPLVMREVDCNRGRADIVCAVFHDNSMDTHKASHYAVALSQLTKARILSWLSKSSPSTETYIQEMTGFGEKTIRKHLRGLIEMGLVEKTAAGLFRLAKSFTLPNVEIWSFEVKLVNWRRALYQALRYRGFSHNVVVVMPSDRLGPPKSNLMMFNTMNVGLVGMNSKGEAKFLCRPKKGRPTSRELYLYGLGRVLSEFGRLYSNTGPEVSQSFSPLSQVSVT